MAGRPIFYIAVKGRGPRNCWDCDHNPCDCDAETKRHKKRGANQLVKRFITLEVEELFREEQEKLMTESLYANAEFDRKYEDAMSWRDYEYDLGGCPCCTYGDAYDDLEPDYYESYFDPREKYAVEAYLVGEWNPGEFHSYTDTWWVDEEAEYSDAYNEWDNEWEAMTSWFDGHLTNGHTHEEPPQHARAYNRRQSAMKDR